MTDELILEIGKSYFSREGYEYEVVGYNNYLKNTNDTVIAVMKHNGIIVHYFTNGKFGHKEINSSYDLIREIKSKKRLEGYLSVWKDNLATVTHWKTLPSKKYISEYTAIIDLSEYNIEYEEK